MINVSKLDLQIESKRQELIDSGIFNGYLDKTTLDLSRELDKLIIQKLGEK